MYRLLSLLLICAPLAAQEWSFSLGAKYWASTFETSRQDAADPTLKRTEDGSGAVGGLSMALSKGKTTFALTAMTDMSDYTLFRIEDIGLEQRFSKADYDLTFNYSFHEYAGLNLGYKRVETENTTVFDGADIATTEIKMNGIIAGLFTKYQFESARVVLSAGAGYGFLNTSNLEGVDFSFETDDASGLTWEAGANWVVGRVVLSLTYKFQDFKYDVTRDDGTSYETKDLLQGALIGARYHF